MSNSTKLHKLAAYIPNGTPFVSLYLNAQADQHGRDAFYRFVRKEFSRREKSFAEGSPERESLKQIADRINAFLEDSLDVSANGIALFANAGSDNFLEAIYLDAPIEKNSLHVLDRPFLFPLARVIDQYPHYVALVADTTLAGIFVFGLGKTKVNLEINNQNTNRSLANERPQLRHEQRLETYRMHFVNEVVEALGNAIRDEHAEHVVLAGDAVIIPLLREQMPADIQDKVIDILRLDINTPEHEILRATMRSLHEDNIHTDAEKVRDLLERFSAGGRATVGLRDTLYALSQGQAEELLITASLKEVRVDQETLESVPSVYAVPNTLVTHVPQPRTSEFVADLLVERAIKTGATVTFIEDPLMLRDFGGVGALLRYRA